jgi:hypothetical protein
MDLYLPIGRVDRENYEQNERYSGYPGGDPEVYNVSGPEHRQWEASGILRGSMLSFEMCDDVWVSDGFWKMVSAL